MCGCDICDPAIPYRLSLHRLDVSKHTSLCRHYVRELNQYISIDDTDDDSMRSCDPISFEISAVVHRNDVQASARKILFTYIMPGGKRVLALPGRIANTLSNEIQSNRRTVPAVFDAAKKYAFQAMERDAFPGFINLGRPLFRVFRKSASLGPLVNRLVLGGASTATAAATRATKKVDWSYKTATFSNPPITKF